MANDAGGEDGAECWDVGVGWEGRFGEVEFDDGEYRTGRRVGECKVDIEGGRGGRRAKQGVATPNIPVSRI